MLRLPISPRVTPVPAACLGRSAPEPPRGAAAGAAGSAGPAAPGVAAPGAAPAAAAAGAVVVVAPLAAVVLFAADPVAPPVAVWSPVATKAESGRRVPQEEATSISTTPT